MNDNAVQDFVKALKDDTQEPSKTYGAYVSHIDDEGIVWVRIAGAETETPTASRSAEVKPNDYVNVEWRNNKLYIAGNTTNPSAGVARVLNVEAAAATAQDAANSAVADAGRAREAAEAVEGIAQQARTAAQAAENGLKSVVQGATTVEKAVSVMQTAMESIIDYDPNTTQETFNGDGTTAAFALQNEATDILSVTVDGESAEYTTAVVSGVTVVTISPAPADEASVVINYEHATVQEWFWHDANGAHILGDTSGYRNDLNSSGMQIVDIATEKNVAEFGAGGAKIGLDGESHLEMDYHSMILVDKEGDPYFYISDLRNKNDNWQATLTETFIGDGEKTLFAVSFGVTSAVSAVDSSDETNYATYRGMEYTFIRPPADGATVTIVYKTTSPNAKAYTLGARAGASGAYSVAEGKNTVASGSMSHAEGQESKAKGAASHAEGVMTEASGMYSHAEGGNAKAKGYCAHAEGEDTEASGRGSHAEGFWLTASGKYSHAEGSKTAASGDYSHAQNQNTTADYEAQTTIGKYNDNRADTAFEIGNGTSIGSRSNAFTVDWGGGVEIAINTSAASGIDHDLYAAITALSWQSDVIV